MQYLLLYPGKMEDAPKLLKIPKSECPDFWIRLPRHKWPKSWSYVEDPVVPLERNLHGRLLAGLSSWARLFEKILLKYVRKRFPIGNAFSYTVKKGCSYLCMWMTSNWLERMKTLIRCRKYSIKKLIWENQHFSLIMYSWDVLEDNVKSAKILLTIAEPCLSHEFPRVELKNDHARKICASLRGPTIWKVMPRNVWNDIVKVSTPCIDDHHFKEELKSVGELSKVCSQIVLKCLYLARIGRPDILWSVNNLARSITKWTKTCDKRLSLLISYIHHTCEYKQYCSVGNTAKQCRLGLFQDSDFAGDLEDSKSTSGGTLCVFGSHTFVPISWMCKKQTSVSHSSTESEIISLDAGFRLDGIPALELWDLIVAVLGNTNQSHEEQGDLLMNKREVRSPPHTIQKRKQSQRVINDLDNVDFVPSNVKSSQQEALLYVFEDNEAVIKMIIKGRNPTMRHVS